MKTTIDRPFEHALAAMRRTGRTRRNDDLRRRAEASAARAEQICAALARIEDAERLIERLVADLGREISPDIRLERRFYDGRWRLTARLDELWIEPDGCPRRATSQVDFLLAAPAGTDRLSVEGRSTVSGRELPAVHHDATRDDGTLADCVEQALLAFAAAWLDGNRPATRPLAA